MPPISKTPEQISLELSPQLAGRVLADRIGRHVYSTDASIFRIMPLAVVQPASTEDLRRTILYAHENRIPLAARGAGSGLAGEALTSGIVIDLSLHLQRIIKLDPEHARVIVEPGVVWGALNRALKPLGKIFGPDPSTGNRCTLGGMIANNSAGAHSLQYGMTNRWVRRLKVMLDDGSVLDLEPRRLSDPIFQAATREARILGRCLALMKEQRELIEKTWPSAPRNRHGYLLKHVLEGDTLDLTQLFCASEGTLGIILEAELEVSPLPSHAGLLSVSFPYRIAAANATAALLECRPSAIELIDRYCLDMARQMPAYRALYPDVDTVLLIEFQGEDQSQIERQLRDAEQLAREAGANGIMRCNDPERRALVWEMRKHISGMINRVPGRKQPAALIEDACVAPEKLGAYISGVEAILSRHDIEFLCFGHAGDGTLHIRPYLDRKDPQLLKGLPAICSEVYDLTLSLGGTISAEHGDGLLRAPFIKKQYDGLFDTFVELKDLFDPDRILNPGKKIDCRGFESWEQYFRFKGRPVMGGRSLLNFSQPLTEQVEACNGCSACRSREPDGAMCPIFRGLGTEIAATRAKANVMWAWLNGEFREADLAQLREAADFCVNCKMCAVECPAGVSAGDMMIEMKARLAAILGTPLGVHVLLAMEPLLRLGSRMPRLFNALSKSDWIRKASERITGLAAERAAPTLALTPFSKAHPELRRAPAKGPGVALFTDMFSEVATVDVAEACLNVLRHNGVEPILPSQSGSGVMPYTYGELERARRMADFNIEALYPYAKAGYRIVCCEPSAALMLRDEYRRLIHSPECTAVSEATIEVTAFLAELHRAGKLRLDFKPLRETVAYHAPCHLKALHYGTPALALLALIPELKVLAAGAECCGIAGTFGMRRKNYDTSLVIGANLFAFLRRGEVQYGVTECSTCRMQMEHGVPEKKTLHPLQILAAAYGY